MFLQLAAAMLLITTAVFPLARGVERRADYPAITFEYGEHFDGFCAEATGKPIEPAAVEELETRRDEFQNAWQNEAPQLLRATVKLTGAPFRFNQTKAALSLCLPGSLSFPLIINVRPYLRATSGERPRPLTGFTGSVFHETLHRYVNEQRDSLPGKTTPLLRKYRDEPQPVRTHLHLLALFDEVYKSLGRQKDLEEINAYEDTLKFAPFFRRAREIIGREGVKNVICEISRNGCLKTR